MSVTIKRVVAPGLLVLLLSSVLVLWQAPPARAGLEGHCDLGEVCLFELRNYGRSYAGYHGDKNSYGANYGPGSCLSGNWEVWHYSTLYYCSSNEPARIDRNATSIDNDGQSCSSAHHIYLNNVGHDRHLIVSRGGHVATLGSSWNNALRSHDWCE